MVVLYLVAAIACEMVGAMSLRASDGLRKKQWVPVIAGGYLASFALLVLILSTGAGIGVVYGIWAASGIALTAVLARLIWRDPLTKTMGAGIALIATGVLLIEMGAH